MRAALGAIEDLTEAAWGAPYATGVDSLTNTFNSRASGDDLVVAPLGGGCAHWTRRIARGSRRPLTSTDLAGGWSPATGGWMDR